MATAVGSLIIRLQGVVERLEFQDDAERDAFLRHYGDHLDERLRQCLPTWRANRTPPPQGG